MKLRLIAAFALATALCFGQAAATKKAADAMKAAPAASKMADLVDINTASKADLAKLPAIGDAIAAKIVAGRPFKRKDELVSKNIMTEKAYAKVKDLIVAKQK